MPDPHWTPRSQQQIYRKLLLGMSRPGSLQEIGHLCSGHEPWLGILATLCDSVTSLSDPQELISDRDRSFLQAAPATVNRADFVLMRGDVPPPQEFAPNLGSLLSPESGATLILAGNNLSEGPLEISLTGPGIERVARASLSGFHADWLRRRELWDRHYPRGVDLLLTDLKQVMALPRTSRLRILET